jgi:hypothetical protein
MQSEHRSPYYNHALRERAHQSNLNETDLKIEQAHESKRAVL